MERALDGRSVDLPEVACGNTQGIPRSRLRTRPEGMSKVARVLLCSLARSFRAIFRDASHITLYYASGGEATSGDDR